MNTPKLRVVLACVVLQGLGLGQQSKPAPAMPDITFASKRNGATNLFTASFDTASLEGPGRKPKIARVSFQGSDYAPAWSPDGETLALNSHRSGGWKIWLQAAGREPWRLTKTTTSGFNYEYFPAWSPDGERIAFEKWDNEAMNFEVHLVDKDGTNEVNLTRSRGHDRQPSWSPTGREILFTSQRDGNAEIYVMDREGEKVRNLTGEESTDYGASWSPDGTTILFHSNRDGAFRSWLMNADGSDKRWLPGVDAADHLQDWTETDSNSRSIPYQVQRATHGIWSHDGRFVLVTSVRHRNEEVYVVEVATGERRRVTESKVRNITATFRPLHPAPRLGTR